MRGIASGIVAQKGGMMLSIRSLAHLGVFFAVISASSALPIAYASAQKNYGPGVTDNEIKIGQTMPYSGPGSAYGVIGRVEVAYMRMINERGGINGRKITLISYDDAYSPPRTVELTRQLVESDGVLATFQGLGTATQASVQKYLNEKLVPQVLVSSGTTRFSELKSFPWTTPFNPNNRSEAHMWAQYILQNFPDAKVGVLYQNDDLGKDYTAGLREAFGSNASKIVAEESYEVSTPTVDSQILKIKSTGATVFLNLGTPKFAAQAIKKIAELGWKPVHLLNANASGLASTIRPAGLDNSKDIMGAYYLKDATDPEWDADEGMGRYKAFMTKYAPEIDLYNNAPAYGYSAAQLIVEILKRCGDNLTRENILKQATTLNGVAPDLFLPGIAFSTSPSDYRGIKQFQLVRFSGERWVRIGSPLTDTFKSD